MSSTSRDLLPQLYRACHDDLLRYLFEQVRCLQTAQDLSQETFLRLSANTDLRRIDNLRGYLFTTAQHLLIDSIRRTRRQAAGLEDLMSAAADPPATPSGERFVMAAEQLAIVTESLHELPPLCRCIFYLSRFEGLRHREIAERLDISVRTVEANLQRAVLHCTRTLRERNGYPV